MDSCIEHPTIHSEPCYLDQVDGLGKISGTIVPNIAFYYSHDDIIARPDSRTFFYVIGVGMNPSEVFDSRV